MEDEENILESILDDDVEMIDIEEGELVEDHDLLQISAAVERGDDINISEVDKGSDTKNRKRRVNKKKNKKKRKNSGPNAAINIDRFVLDTCRRLKEKKSYMVYTAVGCLGLSALSDIIKESMVVFDGTPGTGNGSLQHAQLLALTLLSILFYISHLNSSWGAFLNPSYIFTNVVGVDAIQACGGQKTADDKRFRTGGGVLWNIIKVREPQAYKEIMKKAKEFEKQFRHPNVKQPPMQKKEDDSPGVAFTLLCGNEGNVSDSSFPKSQKQDQHELSASEEKHVSVHDRLRIPVSYDDDLLGSNADNNAN
ncbi:hypothetical protein TanjilG_00366 [Lupinus angustifolius]|uniref:Phosphorylated adapter RNA export protein n=1 Tax=Lupinus angustifolius TaxID=3871 RepID=A0A1J7GJX6_LUPAN|nr:hypothetical protein TanjilG_00366 [Lupinus angustifolius]